MTAPPFYAFRSPAVAKYWPVATRQRREVLPPSKVPLKPSKRPSRKRMPPALVVERRTARELAALQPVHRIIACLSEWFGRNETEIVGESKGQGLHRIRAVGYHIAKVDYGLGNPRIGRVFNKDQSTVREAVRRLLEAMAAGNTEIAADIEGVRALLREADGFASYHVAIASLRENGVRSGQYEPLNDEERSWAAEGVK